MEPTAARGQTPVPGSYLNSTRCGSQSRAPVPGVGSSFQGVSERSMGTRWGQRQMVGGAAVPSLPGCVRSPREPLSGSCKERPENFARIAPLNRDVFAKWDRLPACPRGLTGWKAGALQNASRGLGGGCHPGRQRGRSRLNQPPPGIFTKTASGSLLVFDIVKQRPQTVRRGVAGPPSKVDPSINVRESIL